MSQLPSTTIKGVFLDEALLLKTIGHLPTQGFSKSDFALALDDSGLNEVSSS